MRVGECGNPLCTTQPIGEGGDDNTVRVRKQGIGGDVGVCG